MRAFLSGTVAATVALGSLANVAAAQDEAALRTAFEGRTVALRIDMPATKDGVEVFPLDPTPVDFREVAQRLKDNGTAIHIGQRMMVTKVVVKGNSHIEFQLGGGGYGTFGDWTGGGPSVNSVIASETKDEKLLRERIKHERDRGTKKRLERELEGLRSERERENARAAADAQQANISRETMLRSRRIESGSRFNIRYRGGIPAEALTPDGVMKALERYVDFSGAGHAGGVPVLASAPGMALVSPGPATAASGVSALRKGMTLEQVDALLGAPTSSADVKDGSLTVTKRSHRKDGMRVTTRFVSGVLVDFAIAPE